MRDPPAVSSRARLLRDGAGHIVYFKVQGSNTWPDRKGFTIHYKFKWEGVNCTWHVWYDDSSFKQNSKWWTTYWC